MKMLFSLYNLISGVSTRLIPLGDDEFDALFDQGQKKTLGQALHGVFEKLAELAVPPFPENVHGGLRHTVKVRNFVAHNYSAARGLGLPPFSVPGVMRV